MNDLMELFELRKRFKIIYDKFINDPSLEGEVKSLVRDIEKLQKKIDVESGFANAQIKTHDFYIKIPTDKSDPAKIEGELAGNLITHVNDIIDVAQPHFSESVAVNLVGMIPSSTILVYDIVDKETKVPHKQYSAESTREKIKSIIKSSSKFMEAGFTKKKLQEFREETGLNNEQAYDITMALLKITPTNKEEIGKIELGMINEGEETILTAANENVLELTKAKSDIYQIIKPEEQTELIGTLGIMEEWEDNHKISILDADKKKHTINYSPTQENIDKIKSLISKQVHIKRIRDFDDRRKWLLVEWLS